MSTEKTFRHTADFHPSLWGNHFLTDSSALFKTIDSASTQEQHETLKQELRRMIMANAEKPVDKLRLIDEVQRLGVAYHFEKEIEDALQKLPQDLDSDSDDLYTVSLHFRLLRQQGIKISCDVFEKFKDGEGKFTSSDIQSMLSLYEAAYLAIQGEDILDEAIDFTTTHLKSTVADHNVSPNHAEQINHALYRPLRKALPRLEARYFMSSINSRNDSYNKTLLNFAKLDFNILQELHQNELNDLTNWWKDLDFTTKLPYARDRLVELYFWVLGTYFEPKYAYGRKIMTKLNYILTIIDDTYDAYGRLEELSLFTEAVERWNIDAIDMLPQYMKLIYRTLLDAFIEIEEDLVKEGRSHCVRYLRETYQKVIGAFFVEAKWSIEGYVPTMEEYMPIALTSCAYPLGITTSFIGMGDLATKEVFEWMSNSPKVVRAASIILRLMDDIQSHEFEQKRGHVASAVECYTKQHGVSEEEAIKIFEDEVENAWKDINEELLMKPTVVARPLLETILNLARVIDFMYKDGDCYTHAYLIKDQIASLLKEPVRF